MKKVSTKNIIISFFILTLLCIAFVVGVTYRNMRHTEIQNTKVKSSLNFLLLNQSVLSDLQELEKNQRGYIFSSKEKFNDQYAQSVKSLISDTSRINDLVKEIPEKTNIAADLKYWLVKKVDNSRKNVSTYDSLGIDAVLLLMNKGIGIQLTDSIKKIILQIEENERNVLNQSNAYLEKSAQNTTYRFLLMASIFFIVLVIFLVIINSDLKKRSNIAAQLSMQASLIDTIPDTIFTTDENFKIKTWNKYASDMYGFSAEEAISKPIQEIFKVEIDQKESDRSLLLLKEKGSYKNEYMVTKKNGKTVFVLASINTIINNEGDITGYVSVHRDITKRRELEKELTIFNTELEQQVKIKTAETINILERITDGFLALDNNFTFTFVNKKAGEILGYEPANMIGKNIFTDFAETTSNTFNEACLHSFKTQQYFSIENHYEPLQIWLENDIYPSPDGLSVFFKDITFKKNAELAIKESEEHYKYLIEHLHAAVVVHRPDTSVMLSNQEAMRLLGISAENIWGKMANDEDWGFVSADAKKLALEEYPVMKVIESGEPLHNIVLGINHPSQKEITWVLINAFPEFDTAGNLKQVVVTFVDITDSKKAEEELKRNDEILNMAQAIAKIGSWEFNFETQDLKWSKELYRIFEAGDLQGKELYEYYRSRYHPDDLEKLDDIIKYAIENSRGYQYQHRIIAKDGTIKHILGIGELIKNNKGELIGLKGSGQDITEIS